MDSKNLFRRDSNRNAVVIFSSIVLLYIVARISPASAAGFENLKVTNACEVSATTNQAHFTHFELTGEETQVELMITGSSKGVQFAVDFSATGSDFQVLEYFTSTGLDEKFNTSTQSGLEDNRFYRIRKIGTEGGCVIQLVKAGLVSTRINSVLMHPNPAQAGEKLGIDISASATTLVEITVKDNSDKILLSQTQQVAMGSGRILVNTEKLNPGIYFVYIKEGAGLTREKLIIR